jgi:SAM-dependent methyltransferase
MTTQKVIESAEIAALVTNRGSVCPLCSNQYPTSVLSELHRSLQRCKACNVWWLDPIPGAEELAQYFKVSGPTDDSAAEAKFVVNRHGVLKLVAARLKDVVRGGRILDVGCAVGYFLSAFFLRDKDWEAHGIEVSPQSVGRAEARGIQMRTGTLVSAGYPDSYFDAVTILDTFCYFTDPHRELVEVQRILKPGGLLAIELPLANLRLWRTTTSIGRALTGTTRPRLQTDHVFFYTPKALTRILSATNFEIRDIVPLPANVNTGLLSVIYRTYSIAAVWLWKVTRGRIPAAPRFVLLAQSQKRT